MMNRNSPEANAESDDIAALSILEYYKTSLPDLNQANHTILENCDTEDPQNDSSTSIESQKDKLISYGIKQAMLLV